MSKLTTFLHSGSIGDVWASLPVIKEYNRKSGKKTLLYLNKDQKAFYYEGATHPTKDDSGEQVMLNGNVINMMIPLLKEQYYIEDVQIWSGEEIHIDLDQLRATYVGMPSFSLSRWYFYVFPDLACNLANRYIEVPETEKDLAKGKIIIARSERYRNEHIDYSFLKKYEDDLIFSGTMKEYNDFCMRFNLTIKKLPLNNFLELGQALKQSKGLLSNQTMIFQIAEGLKIPRIVELCGFAPNVIPVGESAFDFFSQTGVEYYVEYLYNL